MKLLVTGHDGYIGTALVPMLLSAGHEVVGLDSLLFADCVFGERPLERIPRLCMDVRDVEVDHVAGFDAIVHLAAISNDPLGDLNPACTQAINHEAAVRLGRLAKRAGVQRFVFSSSCSNYGASGDDLLDERAPFAPVTPYGESKARAELELARLADESFSPTFLRSATAYGVTPKLRADLVVNNLTGYAFTTGEVLIKSDGMPWRPLVHVEDICRAFRAVLRAPRERVHGQAFNVGSTEENYRVRDVAEIVAQVVPGSRVHHAPGAGPDRRNYRVDCSKIRRVLPDFEPAWTVRAGVEQLHDAYRAARLTSAQFLGPRWLRVKHVRALQDSGRLDADLRFRERAPNRDAEEAR